MFHGDGGFDEFIGEGGDDIWFGSLGRGKFDGMSGYDWTTYDGMKFAVNVDLNTQILPGIPVLPADAALDSFTQVEGASGSTHNDVIRGSDVTAADMPTEGFRGSALDAEGIALIAGLQALLAGAGPASFDAQGQLRRRQHPARRRRQRPHRRPRRRRHHRRRQVAARAHRGDVDLRRERPDGQHRAVESTTA